MFSWNRYHRPASSGATPVGQQTRRRQPGTELPGGDLPVGPDRKGVLARLLPGMLLLLVPVGTFAGATALPHRAAAAAQRLAQPPELAQRATPCTVCHGNRGRATPEGYYPRIAGKPAGYLLHQLENFRADRRHFPTMVYFTWLQNETSLRQFADYFASQQVPYPPPERPPVRASVLGQGRQLARHGDPSRGIPACDACHGTELLGVQPDVPALLGDSQDYLLGQLGAWRIGSRAALTPDCMAHIARRLTSAQLTAVTAWLASQPVPAGAGPQASFTQPPPLRCGSIRPPAARPTTPPPATSTLKRGRELVRLGDCEACHTALGGLPYAGGRAIVTRFGTFYSPNITPDPSTGIGRWSERDFWRAMHEGISRDGRLLYPAFPYRNFTELTRRDVDAIYAYLRTLRPVSRRDRPQALAFPYDVRELLRVWRLLFFHPGPFHDDPTRGAVWNRGAYLVEGIGHCSACHSARNALGAVRSTTRPNGAAVLGWYAPSLTDPREAGLQHWSIAQIVQLLQTGAVGASNQSSPGPSATVAGPMAEVVYAGLQHANAADLRAMAVYLKSLAPSTRAYTVAPRVDHAISRVGQRLYRQQCAACHGARGVGHAPLGPPLAGNRAVTMRSPIDPIRLVLYGGFPPATRGDPLPFGMPPFATRLNDSEIAAVLTYVRQSWGNSAVSVDSQDVEANRGGPLW